MENEKLGVSEAPEPTDMKPDVGHHVGVTTPHAKIRGVLEVGQKGAPLPPKLSQHRPTHRV